MSLPQPFAYPVEPHLRKHAPAGYADYTAYKPWLRDEFDFRCVYCLQRETWSAAGAAAFSIDHIVPRSLDPDELLVRDYSNLLYACLRCNSARQDTPTLDPTREGLAGHVRVEADGSIAARTRAGLEMIRLLQLDHPSVVRERQRILRILGLRVRYPNDTEVRALFRETFGYPDDLPDLRRRSPEGPNPPGGNARPENAEWCYFARRERGQLPVVYSQGECPRFYDG